MPELAGPTRPAVGAARSYPGSSAALLAGWMAGDVAWGRDLGVPSEPRPFLEQGAVLMQHQELTGLDAAFEQSAGLSDWTRGATAEPNAASFDVSDVAEQEFGDAPHVVFVEDADDYIVTPEETLATYLPVVQAAIGPLLSQHGLSVDSCVEDAIAVGEEFMESLVLAAADALALTPVRTDLGGIDSSSDVLHVGGDMATGTTDPAFDGAGAPQGVRDLGSEALPAWAFGSGPPVAEAAFLSSDIGAVGTAWEAPALPLPADAGCVPGPGSWLRDAASSFLDPNFPSDPTERRINPYGYYLEDTGATAGWLPDPNLGGGDSSTSCSVLDDTDMLKDYYREVLLLPAVDGISYASPLFTMLPFTTCVESDFDLDDGTNMYDQGNYAWYDPDYARTIFFTKRYTSRTAAHVLIGENEFRAGIVGHEMVHLVDHEDLETPVTTRVACGPPDARVATEYRGAWVQAKVYGLSDCSADVFGCFYYRKVAGQGLNSNVARALAGAHACPQVAAFTIANAIFWLAFPLLGFYEAVRALAGFIEFELAVLLLGIGLGLV